MTRVTRNCWSTWDAPGRCVSGEWRKCVKRHLALSIWNPRCRLWNFPSAPRRWPGLTWQEVDGVSHVPGDCQDTGTRAYSYLSKIVHTAHLLKSHGSSRGPNSYRHLSKRALNTIVGIWSFYFRQCFDAFTKAFAFSSAFEFSISHYEIRLLATINLARILFTFPLFTISSK